MFDLTPRQGIPVERPFGIVGVRRVDLVNDAHSRGDRVGEPRFATGSLNTKWRQAVDDENAGLVD